MQRLTVEQNICSFISLMIPSSSPTFLSPSLVSSLSSFISSSSSPYTSCLFTHSLSLNTSCSPLPSEPLPHLDDSSALLTSLVSFQRTLSLICSSFSCSLDSITERILFVSCSEFITVVSAVVNGLKNDFYSFLSYYTSLRDTILSVGVGCLIDSQALSDLSSCFSPAYWIQENKGNPLKRSLLMIKEAELFMKKTFNQEQNQEENSWNKEKILVLDRFNPARSMTSECGILIKQQENLLVIENRGVETIQLEQLMIAEWNQQEQGRGNSSWTVRARFVEVNKTLGPAHTSGQQTNLFSSFMVKVEFSSLSSIACYKILKQSKSESPVFDFDFEEENQLIKLINQAGNR
jgi:hypothetical protein